MPENLIQKLKEHDIEILYLQNYTNINLKDEKYKLPKEIDYWRHPNGKTWDVVSDILIKGYNL